MRLAWCALASLAFACSSGGGSGGDGGLGSDSGGQGTFYDVNFTSTGAIVGTWTWEQGNAIQCFGGRFDITLTNKAGMGSPASSITVMGDGSFVFRGGGFPGGLSGKGMGGSTWDANHASWSVTFANTTASDTKGNSATLNGTIKANCNF
jgi:hypothetical protein